MAANKTKTKIGIYLCAILMMGAIAVSSNIANIATALDLTTTEAVTWIVSIPCLVVIPITLISGWLMRYVSKKILMIIGILCWLVGGCVPYFMDALGGIIAMRFVFGVGIGLVQTLCSALVAENFPEENERAKVLGTMNSFQMLGAIIFSIVSGYLGAIAWNVAFLVHLMALVSLVACITCVPNRKPVAATGGEKPKFRATGMMWVWAIAFLIFMVAGQTYSNFASTIITQMNFGGPAEAGYSLAFFAFGGFLMGFLFGNIQKIFGRMTLTVGGVVLAVSYLIMTFAPNLVVSYIGAFICGLAFSICMPCIINGAAGAVDVESSGMAVSIATCCQNVGMTICPYIVTPLGAMMVSSGITAEQGGMVAGVIVIVIMAIIFGIINMRQKASK